MYKKEKEQKSWTLKQLEKLNKKTMKNIFEETNGKKRNGAKNFEN